MSKLKIFSAVNPPKNSFPDNKRIAKSPKSQIPIIHGNIKKLANVITVFVNSVVSFLSFFPIALAKSGPDTVHMDVIGTHTAFTILDAAEYIPTSTLPNILPITIVSALIYIIDATFATHITKIGFTYFAHFFIEISLIFLFLFK